jgi:exodeoxyribonuclease VII small subunit
MAKKKANFEDALVRLEKIVDDLETGDLTLDLSIAKYESGVGALKECYDILRDAEKKVEILLQGELAEGGAKTAPFNAKASDSDTAE